MTLMALEAPQSRARLDEWWIAVARPQFEQRLTDILNELGAFAFSPREIITKTYKYKDRAGNERTKDREWTRPIFGNYVFFSGDRDLAFEADVTIGVLKTTHDDCDDIEQIRKAYGSGELRRARGVVGVKVGMKVKVIGGPFMGTEGYVERFGDNRVFLHTRVCGTAEFHTDLSNIEPLIGD